MIPGTFGATQRFRDLQLEHTENAQDVSALDYNHRIEILNAPSFNRFAERSDNFLTNEQIQAIEIERKENAERKQRMQAMRAEQERIDKNRQHNTGDPDTVRQLRFQYEDHKRALQMKPLMLEMHA